MNTETVQPRSVVQTIRGRPTSDGAGVRLTRVIDGSERIDLDPFLLLDEFRSDQAGDYIAGFPDHPHRGFETVTYMLAGRMRHRDSAGNSGLLVPGSVQWMTAGRGLVHSEMPEQEDGLMWGFQLWVNLPACDKMTTPRYQDIPAAQIPAIELGAGVKARVLAGRLRGTAGPVETGATAATYLDFELAAGAACEERLGAPDDTAFIYVYDGQVEAGAAGAATSLPRGTLGVLGAGNTLRLAAGATGAKCIVIAGRRLREPVARYGPFVMNTRSEIEQAFADYQAGRL
jgi:redox-sensitive bicupin YhaK (pirin superfamily)